MSQSTTGWRLITVAWGDENLALSLSLSCLFLTSFTPPFSGKRMYEVKKRHNFLSFLNFKYTDCLIIVSFASLVDIKQSYMSYTEGETRALSEQNI